MIRVGERSQVWVDVGPEDDDFDWIVLVTHDGCQPIWLGQLRAVPPLGQLRAVPPFDGEQASTGELRQALDVGEPPRRLLIDGGRP